MDPRSTETGIAPLSAQDDSPKENPFAEVARQNEGLAQANITEPPSFTETVTQAPVFEEKSTTSMPSDDEMIQKFQADIEAAQQKTTPEDAPAKPLPDLRALMQSNPTPRALRSIPEPIKSPPQPTESFFGKMFHKMDEDGMIPNRGDGVFSILKKVVLLPINVPIRIVQTVGENIAAALKPMPTQTV